jgi:hypothetical protein
MRRTVALLALFALFTMAATAQQQEPFAQDDVRVVVGPNIETRTESATITWQTNNVAATMVRYGTDSNNLDREEFQRGGRREHRAVLTGLQPGTTYYYEILTQDQVVRNRGQFRTEGTPQAGIARPGTQAQIGREADDVRIVEGPDFEPMADGRAVITWRTNNVAATHVLYGTDPNNLTETAYQPGGRREHRVELTGLQPGRQYHFALLTREKQVRTTGQFRYDAQATQQQQQQRPRSVWDTRPQQPEAVNIVSGPDVQTVDDTTAVVTWRTNTRSSSVVRYGTDPNRLNQVSIDQWGTDHRVTLPNLRANTAYYFEVESSPGPRRGPETQTARGQFQTGGQAGIAAPQR